MYYDSDNDNDAESKSGGNNSMLSAHSKKSMDFRLGNGSPSRMGVPDGLSNNLHYKNHCVYGNGTVFESAKEEMAAIQTKREYFENMFDKFIDKDKNGDVDMQEFRDGLRAMGIKMSSMSDEDAQLLFELLIIEEEGADDETDDAPDVENQTIDKQTFSDFLTRRFDAETLRKYQECLVLCVSDKASHGRKKTLLSHATMNEWDAQETDIEAMQMKQTIEAMVDQTMTSVQQQQEWKDELERRMQHPDFGNDENALQWDCYEVSYWVDSIGFGESMKKFFDHKIDGSMLLYDIKHNNLAQLGITRMHMNKFMRSIDALRKVLSSPTSPVFYCFLLFFFGCLLGCFFFLWKFLHKLWYFVILNVSKDIDQEISFCFFFNFTKWGGKKWFELQLVCNRCVVLVSVRPALPFMFWFFC